VFHRRPFHGACNAWTLAWLAMLGPKWMKKKRTTDKKATRVVGGTGIFGEVGGSLGLTWSCLDSLLGPTWTPLGTLGLIWIHLDPLGLLASFGFTLWLHLTSPNSQGFTFGLYSLGSLVDSL